MNIEAQTHALKPIKAPPLSLLNASAPGEEHPQITFYSCSAAVHPKCCLCLSSSSLNLSSPSLIFPVPSLIFPLPSLVFLQALPANAKLRTTC